jgi:hypothetical protein
MIDTGRALLDGRDAVLQVLPATFNWPLFWVAWLLMASPALHQVAGRTPRVESRAGPGGAAASTSSLAALQLDDQ